MKKIILALSIVVIAVLNFTLVKSKTSDLTLKSLTELSKAYAEDSPGDRKTILTSTSPHNVVTSSTNLWCCATSPCIMIFQEWGHVETTNIYTIYEYRMENNAYQWLPVDWTTTITNGPYVLLYGPECN